MWGISSWFLGAGLGSARLRCGLCTFGEYLLERFHARRGAALGRRR
jgi:hypothetical protein